MSTFGTREFLEILKKCVNFKHATVRHINRNCRSTVTLGFNEQIQKLIKITERPQAKRIRYISVFDRKAYTRPELRDTSNFTVLSCNLQHSRDCYLNGEIKAYNLYVFFFKF